MQKRVFVLVVMVLALAAAAPVRASDTSDEYGNAIITEQPAAAEPGPGAPAVPDTYGTASWIVENLHSSAFHGFHGGEYWMANPGYIVHDTGHSFYETNFQLPTGAVLHGYTSFYYDNSATQQLTLWIWQHTFRNIPPSEAAIAALSSGVAATPGYVSLYTELAPAHTVVASSGGALKMYTVRVNLSSTDLDTTIAFGGLSLWYKLQVSPAPVTATFGDVPTSHPYFRFVEALYASGITGGCGGGNYCPNNTLTRGEMAVFLSAALGLHFPDTQ